MNKLLSILTILIITSCGKNTNGALSTISPNIVEKSLSSRDGQERGNGGDHIRLEFIKRGAEILNAYEAALKQIFSKTKFEQMKTSLNINQILLSHYKLYDYSGSQVSAIEKEQILTLYIGNEPLILGWEYILKNSKNINQLILHEILRLGQINDDNYIYSNKIIHSDKEIQLKYDIKLPKELHPFNEIETINNGIRSDLKKSSRHCGSAYKYELIVTGKMLCVANTTDDKKATCSFFQALSGKYIMSITGLDSSELIAHLNNYSDKAILNCNYKAEKKISCKNSQTTFFEDYSCTLKLPEFFDKNGKRKNKKKAREQQQQQQQRTGIWKFLFGA